MSIKIRVSYREPQELHTVLEMLKPIVTSCKADKGRNGAFKRAYLEADIPDRNAQKSADSPLI